MIKKWHINLSFKWFNFWIGLFIDRPGKAVYLCLLPMLPIKIWFVEHLECPCCGEPMKKIAVLDAGDGWALYWSCKECGDEFDIAIDWPFPDDAMMSVEKMERRGFEVV
jgi:hypothetical protein